MGTLADKRKRRHGENTLRTRKYQFISMQKITNYCKKGETEKKNRKNNYSPEHDFLVCPALFPISPHSLIIFLHACQVALSPILQVMNNLHTVIRLLQNSISKIVQRFYWPVAPFYSKRIQRQAN